jgi:hypothetical protein
MCLVIGVSFAGSIAADSICLPMFFSMPNLQANNSEHKEKIVLLEWKNYDYKVGSFKRNYLFSAGIFNL